MKDSYIRTIVSLHVLGGEIVTYGHLGLSVPGRSSRMVAASQVSGTFVPVTVWLVVSQSSLYSAGVGIWFLSRVLEMFVILVLALPFYSGGERGYLDYHLVLALELLVEGAGCN